MSKKAAAAVIKPQSTIHLIGLHGHAMTGSMFERKIGSIRSEVKKLNCTFYFPTGPIESPPDWFAGPSSPATNNETAAATATAEVAQPPLPAAAAVDEPQPTTTDGSTTPATATTESSRVSDPPRSWMDFWSARKEEAEEGKMDVSISIFPYRGVPESLRLLAEYTKTLGTSTTDTSAPLVDGHFAFSQGTCISVIWLAVAMRQVRLEIEEILSSEKKEGDGTTVVGDAPDSVVAEEDLPLESWRLPQHMLLLKQTIPIDSTTTPVRPFLVVNGSGLVPRDDMFGTFVKSEALKYGKLLQHLKELNDGKGEGDVLVVKADATSKTVLRPIVSLHCFGTADDLIKPEMSKGLVELFRTIDTGVATVTTATSSSSMETGNIKEEANKGYETTPVPGAEAVSVWSHDGGHVMPAQFRKPFKQYIQSVAAKF